MATKTVDHESSSVHCDQCHNKVERGKMSVHLAEECAKVDRLREQSSDHTPRGLSLELPQRECERKLQQMLERQQTMEERLKQTQQESQSNDNHLESVIRNQLARNRQEQYNLDYQRRLRIITVTNLIVLGFILGLMLGHAQKNAEQEIVLNQVVQELKQQIEHLENHSQIISINRSVQELKQYTENRVDRSVQELEQQFSYLKIRIEGISQKLKGQIEQQKVASQDIKERMKMFEKKEKQNNKFSSKMKNFVDLYTPPYTFEMRNYQLTKSRQTYYESPPLYTHPGGYKFQLFVYPNVQENPYLSIVVRLLKGTYDDVLKFPARFTITLALLNQHNKKDHYTRDIECEATWDKLATSLSLDLFGFGLEFSASKWIGADSQFISHTKLKEDTQFLKDDSIKFRVLNILLKEKRLT